MAFKHVFFLPKKLRDAQALDSAAAGFETQVGKAEKLADPAERVAAALQTGEDIQKYDEDVQKRLKKRAFAFGRVLPAAVIGLPLYAGLLGAAAVLGLGSVATIILLAVTSMLFKEFTKETCRAFGRTQENLLKDPLEKIRQSSLRAGQIADKTLDQQAPEVQASPKFSSLYASFAKVRGHFDRPLNQAAAMGRPTPAAAPANRTAP